MFASCQTCSSPTPGTTEIRQVKDQSSEVVFWETAEINCSGKCRGAGLEGLVSAKAVNPQIVGFVSGC
jgi:hypothetical protein